MDDVAGTKKAKPKLKLASFNPDIELKIKAPASHQESVLRTVSAKIFTPSKKVY